MGTTQKFECDYIRKSAKYLSALPKDPTHLGGLRKTSASCFSRVNIRTEYLDH